MADILAEIGEVSNIVWKNLDSLSDAFGVAVLPK